MFFFSACGIKNNQTSSQSNIDVACTSKSETKVENLVIEDIKSTIHTFLDEYYKNINIVDNVFEGENIDYDIYYEERGYIIVKIAQEEEESNYLNGIFEVKMDSSLKNIVISDVEKCKSIWNSQDLILLSSDQLYKKKDLEVTYEDFDGKKERLLALKENIIKHYFNKTDILEHSNRPIFAESTEANSVYLLNFDQETLISLLLIGTIMSMDFLTSISGQHVVMAKEIDEDNFHATEIHYAELFVEKYSDDINQQLQVDSIVSTNDHRKVNGECVLTGDMPAVTWELVNRKAANWSSFYGSEKSNTLWNIATKAYAYSTITGGSADTDNARNPVITSTKWKQATWYSCALFYAQTRSELSDLVYQPTGINK